MPPVLFDIRTRNRQVLERTEVAGLPKWVVRHVWDDKDPERIEVGASVAVYCRHGRRKRAIRDLVADTSREHVHGCECCECLYAKPSDEPGPCPACTPPSPRRAA